MNNKKPQTVQGRLPEFHEKVTIREVYAKMQVTDIKKYK